MSDCTRAGLKRNRDTRIKVASAVLITLGVICLWIAWKFGWNDRAFRMDYKLPEIESSAVQGPAGSASGHVPDVDGHVGSVTYSDQLWYNADTKVLSLVFRNPAESRVGMTIAVEVAGKEIWQSGLLNVGYGVEDVKIKDPGLKAGVYDCELVVRHYYLNTGEKASVEMRLDAHLTVTKNAVESAGID